MDSLGQGGGFDAGDVAPAALASDAAGDVAAEIGADERRMHVRAYNYWAGQLRGRDFPSIDDLDPRSVADFGPHSVLLDFTSGRDCPATPFIGTAIRAECGLAGDIRTIADVPSRSLLSRLTDHYLQIIANRAPIGFEAEFVNQDDRGICYRGILLPFSSDGATIDFIYGVINWKEAADAPSADPATRPVEAPRGASGDFPGDAHLSWDDGPLGDAEMPAPPADAALADRLSAARDSAEVCKQNDGRSRAALYRALAMAYDFAVATRRAVDDYAEILEDAGLRAQVRAPMTPIVKLVFGADYDKTRLTEFAAALAFAQRSAVDFAGFLPFIEKQKGGLKALVAAERIARRPNLPLDDRRETARAALRRRLPIALADLPPTEEFTLVLTRRAHGTHEIVALVDDAALLERAIRTAS